MKRIITVLLAAMMLFSGLQIAMAEEIPEAAASEESLVQEPVAETPAEVPAAEEPAAEEPAAEVTAETPVAEEPIVTPATEEPATEAPAEETAEKTEAEEAADDETGAVEAETAETAEEPETTVPAEVEIEDYETPLGLQAIRTIVLDNLGEATISFRESPDGMSDVIEELPENTELAIISIDEDWAKAVAAERIGYVFTEDLRTWLEPEETKEADGEDIKVTIFSSRKRVMEVGETVLLTSRIEGFEGYEIRYQWECDKHDGAGFRDVDGANESEYGFSASADSLSWDWRLSVYYR